MFIEFENQNQMFKACQKAHDFVLDKNHRFISYPFDNIEKYSMMEETEFVYTPAEYHERVKFSFLSFI